MRTMVALLGTSQTSALYRVHNNLIGAVLASRRKQYIDVDLRASQSLPAVLLSERRWCDHVAKLSRFHHEVARRTCL